MSYNYKTDNEQVSCNMCGKDNYSVYFKSEEGYQIVKCNECGHCYTNPRPSMKALPFYYTEDYFKDERHFKKFYNKDGTPKVHTLTNWNNIDNCSNLVNNGCTICPLLLNDALHIIDGTYIIEGFENTSITDAQLRLYQFLIASETDLNNDSLLISQQQSLLSNSIVNQFLVDFSSTNWVQLGVVANFLATDNYEDADANNDAIEANDELTAFAQQYYSLYIAYMKDPLIIKDSTYCSAVFELAQACPLQYGSIVYLAQAFYSLIDPNAVWDSNIPCENVQSRKSQSILNFKKKNSLLPIKEIQNDLVSIYPNPASGIFKIEYNNKVNENYLLEIYSIEGVKLSAKKIEFTNGKSDWIDCSHLIAGNYYIRIITPKETIVKKINLIK